MSKGRKNNGPVGIQEIEEYLRSLKPDGLVQLILNRSDEDEAFFSELQLLVASSRASSDTTEIKRLLRKAMRIPHFVEWNQTYSYIRGIERVLTEVRKLLTPEKAHHVVELAEIAMDLWEENIGLIDDSNGCMGELRDELHELHFQACAQSHPDALALGERLAKRALASEWEMFRQAYPDYFQLLGEEGRKRFREIVEVEWDTLPTFGPNEEDPEKYGSSFSVDQLMLSIVETDGDLHEIIRVLSRDVSSAYSYLQIAERCRDAGELSLATEWAEKGLKNFLHDRDTRLRTFLAEAYLNLNRPEDAMAMVWSIFERKPALSDYQMLAGYAQKLECWEFWREKAFARMRTGIAKETAEFTEKTEQHASQFGKRWGRAIRPPDHSLLVQVFLWEKYADKAWAEAQEGGCSESLWLDLAKRFEKKHPEEVIHIYSRQVAPLIEKGNNDSYHDAVAFMGKVYRLTSEIGKEEKFKTWAQNITTDFKRKRNFITYVKEEPWADVLF